MSTLWCTHDDVMQHLGFVKSHSVDDSKTEPRIVRARDDIIQEFTGKFSTDLVDDTWLDENSTPPQVRRLAAMRAAALILQEEFGESMYDQSSPAYGLRREYETVIKRIKDDELIIATSQSDSTAVSPTETMMTTNRSSTDKLYNADRMGRFTGTS